MEEHKERGGGPKNKKRKGEEDDNPDAGEPLEDWNESEAAETMSAELGPPTNVVNFLSCEHRLAAISDYGVSFRRHKVYPNLILFKYSQVCNRHCF